jgi:hypothetical protein
MCALLDSRKKIDMMIVTICKDLQIVTFSFSWLS